MMMSYLDQRVTVKPESGNSDWLTPDVKGVLDSSSPHKLCFMETGVVVSDPSMLFVANAL